MWVRYVKEKQIRFMNSLESVYHISLERVIFKAWYNVMVDAKNTRLYFEVRNIIKRKFLGKKYKLPLVSCSFIFSC